jgi:hypothetical protein
MLRLRLQVHFAQQGVVARVGAQRIGRPGISIHAKMAELKITFPDEFRAPRLLHLLYDGQDNTELLETARRSFFMISRIDILPPPLRMFS